MVVVVVYSIKFDEITHAHTTFWHFWYIISNSYAIHRLKIWFSSLCDGFSLCYMSAHYLTFHMRHHTKLRLLPIFFLLSFSHAMSHLIECNWHMQFLWYERKFVTNNRFTLEIECTHCVNCEWTNHRQTEIHTDTTRWAKVRRSDSHTHTNTNTCTQFYPVETHSFYAFRKCIIAIATVAAIQYVWWASVNLRNNQKITKSSYILTFRRAIHRLFGLYEIDLFNSKAKPIQCCTGFCLLRELFENDRVLCEFSELNERNQKPKQGKPWWVRINEFGEKSIILLLLFQYKKSMKWISFDEFKVMFNILLCHRAYESEEKNTNHLRLPINNKPKWNVFEAMANDEMILIFFPFRLHFRLVVMIQELQSFRQKAAFTRSNMQWKPYRMPEPVLGF